MRVCWCVCVCLDLYVHIHARKYRHKPRTHVVDEESRPICTHIHAHTHRHKLSLTHTITPTTWPGDQALKNVLKHIAHTCHIGTRTAVPHIHPIPLWRIYRMQLNASTSSICDGSSVMCVCVCVCVCLCVWLCVFVCVCVCVCKIWRVLREETSRMQRCKYKFLGF